MMTTIACRRLPAIAGQGNFPALTGCLPDDVKTRRMSTPFNGWVLRSHLLWGLHSEWVLTMGLCLLS